MIRLRMFELGTRVVVRYRLPDGRASDALGVLRQLNEATAVIETKRGLESVPLADVLLARAVPPAARRPEKPSGDFSPSRHC